MLRLEVQVGGQGWTEKANLNQKTPNVYVDGNIFYIQLQVGKLRIKG